VTADERGGSEGPPHAKGEVRPRVVIRPCVVTRVVVRAPVVVRARGVVVVVVVVRASGVVIRTIETGVANTRVKRSRRNADPEARPESVAGPKPDPWGVRAKRFAGEAP